MKSLLLDRTAWDLVTDANGDIACCTEPYAIAQDVACACRLFLGELWYQTNKGIPYFQDILGHWPPLPLVKKYLENAAKTVPGVSSVQVTITGVSGRALTGQVQFIDDTGAANGVTF